MNLNNDPDLASLRSFALILFGVPLLIVLCILPEDCFPGAQIANTYKWIYLLCFAISVAGSWYFLHRAHYMVMKKGSERMRPALAPFFILFMGPSIGFALLALVVQSLSLLVLVTSSQPAQYSTRIALTGRSRHCRMNISFYNPPIGRSIGLCGDNRLPRNAKSGDTVLLRETVGPFGAHIQSISLTE